MIAVRAKGLYFWRVSGDSESGMNRQHWTLLIVFTMATVACGSSVEGTEGGVLAEIVDQEAELFEFSACMRGEGIDIGDPTVDAEGNVALGTPMSMISDHGALMEAYGKCRDLVGGRALGHGGEDRNTVHDRLVEFAKCVRDNGYYDMPDPDFSDSRGDIFPGLKMDDPDYQAAEAVCKGLLVDDGDPG